MGSKEQDQATNVEASLREREEEKKQNPWNTTHDMMTWDINGG